MKAVSLFLFFIAAGAACAASPQAGAGKVQVVAAFYPLEEVARRIGGPQAEVFDLTPPGAEPHDLELRPSDLRRVRSAGLVLYLGEGFQPALERAVATMADKSRAIDVLADMQLRPAAGEEAAAEAADPHVWLSPLLMERIATSTAGALSARSPSRASEFRARQALLMSDLDSLDREYQSKLSSCVRRDIFTSHAAFGYLADRYGLDQVAITGLSPEAEPSPKRLEEVARLARERGATTIFFETLVSPRVADAVARTAGAKTAVLDPIEGLTPAERKAGADYFSIMRSNLGSLTEALGCRT
jgi:zinc transport system substrate-binding protein